MPNKLPAILASIFTFILLLTAGLLLFFVQIIALNGVMSESKAFTSLGIGAICQGITLLFATGFAGWFSNWLIQKFDWNKVVSVVIAVILGTLLGVVTSFLSTVISIPLAGIQ